MKVSLRFASRPLFVTLCVASLSAIVAAVARSYPPWRIVWNWSDDTSANVPKPRQAHTSVNCDGLMVVYGGFGGKHEEDFFKDTWVWDTRAEENLQKWYLLDGKWAAGGADGTLRATHATAAWYDDTTKLCTLVAFAGVTHSGQQQLYDNTAITVSLDPQQVRDWISGKQSHVGSKGWSKVSANGSAPQHRNEHVMVVHNDDFYVHGGMYISATGRSDYSLTVYGGIWVLKKESKAVSRDDKSQVTTWTWEKVTLAAGSPTPPSRYTHAAAVLPPTDSTKGGAAKVVIYGGRTTTRSSSNSWAMLNDVWMFNTYTKVWSELMIDGPKYDRMYHSLVFWNNHLVAFGGYKLVQENYQYPIGFVYDKILAINLGGEERGSLMHNWKSNCIDADKYGITVRMAHTAILEKDTMYFYGGRFRQLRTDFLAANMSEIQLCGARGDMGTSGATAVFNVMIMAFLGLMLCFCGFIWCGSSRDYLDGRRGYSQGPPRLRVSTQRMIDALPVEIYKKPEVIDTTSNDHSCAICLDDYEDGDEIRVLKCKHRYHKQCIDMWLKNSVQCPFCKRPIDTREFENRVPLRAARVSPRPSEETVDLSTVLEGAIVTPGDGEGAAREVASPSTVPSGVSSAQVMQAHRPSVHI